MNKKNLLSVFLLTLMLAVITNGFTQDIEWEKNFGGKGWDYYYAVTTVSDGTVAVGHSEPNSFGNGDWTDVTGKGDVDAIIVKYDNSGNVVWKKNFGGKDKDYFTSVTAVSDGIVAVGHSNTSSFDNGDWVGVTKKGGTCDATIVKFDNSGNVVWKKNFGGASPEYFKSVTAVSDGIVVVGFSAEGSFGTGDWTGVAGRGGEDAIMVKYDNNGNVVWKKNFGNCNDDCYLSVTAVSDGVVAVGASYGVLYSPFDNGDWIGVTGKGSFDAIVVKYNNSGNVVWKKNFGGKHGDRYLSVTAVSDGIIATGYSAEGSFNDGDWIGVTGRGGEDAIMVKYDNGGNVVWKKNFGGKNSDSFTSVTTTSNGIVAVGNSNGFHSGDWINTWGYGDYDATIVKYDNSGNVVWSRCYGGAGKDYFESVTAVSDNIVAAGYSNSTSLSGNGGSDAIIVKYQPNVGIIEQDNYQSLRVYPNPTSGELRIENGEWRIGDYIVYNVMGQTVLQGRLQEEITIINVEPLRNGTYFLRIGDKVITFVRE
jgi:hypothetical protein